jgi:hypothetical protein
MNMERSNVGKHDKEVFLLSAVTGFLGALAYLLGRTIDQAQREQKRAMEDARTRFEHEQKTHHGRRDV